MEGACLGAFVHECVDQTSVLNANILKLCQSQIKQTHIESNFLKTNTKGSTVRLLIEV